MHSGDSASVLPPHSLGPEMLRALREQTAGIALGPRRRRADQRPVRDLRRPPLRDRGQPARVADGPVRLEGGRRAAREDGLPADAGRADRRPRAARRRSAWGGRSTTSRSRRRCCPFDRFTERRRHPRAGDALDRRGHGHRPRLPDRVRQGAGRRGRGAAAPRDGLPHRDRLRQGGGPRDRRPAARPRLRDRRHGRHGAGDPRDGRARARRSPRSARATRTSSTGSSRARSTSSSTRRPARARAPTAGRSAARRRSTACRASPRSPAASPRRARSPGRGRPGAADVLSLQELHGSARDAPGRTTRPMPAEDAPGEGRRAPSAAPAADAARCSTASSARSSSCCPAETAHRAHLRGAARRAGAGAAAGARRGARSRPGDPALRDRGPRPHVPDAGRPRRRVRQGRRRLPAARRARVRLRRGRDGHPAPAARQPEAAALPAEGRPRAGQPPRLQQPGDGGGARSGSRAGATARRGRRRRQRRAQQDDARRRGRPTTTSRRRARSRRTPTTSSSTSARRTRPACATSRPSSGCARCSTASARRSAAKPLLLKIAPDLADEDVDAVADLALELELDGIIATNTTIDRAGPRDAGRRDRRRSGPAGCPARRSPRGHSDILRRLRARVGDRLLLVAAGGIEDAGDAWARIEAGATLVQLYTGFVYGGPTAPATSRAVSPRSPAATDTPAFRTPWAAPAYPRKRAANRRIDRQAGCTRLDLK